MSFKTDATEVTLLISAIRLEPQFWTTGRLDTTVGQGNMLNVSISAGWNDFAVSGAEWLFSPGEWVFALSTNIGEYTNIQLPGGAPNSLRFLIPNPTSQPIVGTFDGGVRMMGVNEPSAVALFGAGLFLSLFARRFRVRRAPDERRPGTTNRQCHG